MLSNSTYIQPPFDEEYYKRRCTIRFCIVGLVILLLDSASLSMVILLKGKKHSNILSLLSLFPFMIHSILLIWAVVLLRSSRKTISYINQCGLWCTNSKWLSPTIILEMVAMRDSGFDMWIQILTVMAFGAAVYKVNIIMKNVIIPTIMETINLNTQTEFEQTVPVEIQQVNQSSASPPPSYDEAMKNEIHGEHKDNRDPPPTYNEITLLN